jgi:hypothetical protein
MHFCCHVDDNWFVRHAPFVNTIRRHHTAHHNQSIMMERNMNLTFPVMDWLLGTSDLDRGLIGHLFNGYDTRFVKTNMRKTSRTPKAERDRPVDRLRHTRPNRTKTEPAMEAIEPNWVSSLWFAAFATICTVAFLVVAGMFPLRSRPDSARSGGVTLLIVGNATLLAALALGTALYGYTELRWSTLIVVAGLACAVYARAVRGFPIVVTRRKDRTGRPGRRSNTGARALAKSRGPSLPPYPELPGGSSDARQNQTRSFTARRAGHGDCAYYPARTGT